MVSPKSISIEAKCRGSASPGPVASPFHVYIFAHWVLDVLDLKPHFSSAKFELLPYLVRKQFLSKSSLPESTVRHSQRDSTGSAGSAPNSGGPQLSDMDMMLADLAFAARPPPVITPDESGANGPNSGGSGDLGGGIASISPSAFSPGEMIKMMGTPTPAPVKDDRSAKSPEAGSDQGSSAAGDSA